jgi:hypothetical protein
MKPKENSNKFVIPAGLHDAICYGVVHAGTVNSPYNNQPRMRNVLYLCYEFPAIKNVFDEDKGEQPAVTTMMFTYSYSEKGNLLDWINTWSNGKINKKNITDFDIEKLAGLGCKLQIIMDESEGKTRSYPKGIIGLTAEEKKTLNKNSLYNPIMIYDVDNHDQEAFDALPNWLQKKVMESQEYKKLGIKEPEKSDIPAEEDEAAF